MVWYDGPVTPYAVRRLARESRSPHLSTSAGSMYPLIERLEKRGFVAGEPLIRGKREGTAYRITKEGLAELRAWIAKPAREIASGALVDPIRTRMMMLGALPPNKRREVVAALRRALEEDLEDVMTKRKEFESSDSPYALAAWRGDLLVQRARLKWLKDVERDLLS